MLIGNAVNVVCGRVLDTPRKRTAIAGAHVCAVTAQHGAFDIGNNCADLQNEVAVGCQTSGLNIDNEELRLFERRHFAGHVLHSRGGVLAGNCFLEHGHVEVIAPQRNFSIGNSEDAHEGNFHPTIAHLEAVGALIHDNTRSGVAR